MYRQFDAGEMNTCCRSVPPKREAYARSRLAARSQRRMLLFSSRIDPVSLHAAKRPLQNGGYQSSVVVCLLVVLPIRSLLLRRRFTGSVHERLHLF
jgi:hypothetical protein